MIVGLLLLALSLVMVAFAGINLRNCVSKGTATAYGHSYSRFDNPTAFWVSVTCSVVAVLLGLGLSLASMAGLLGLV